MTRATLAIALLVLVAGCAPQIRGDVTYDPNALYRNYQTVAWVEGQGVGSSEVRAITEKGVRTELEKDNLRFVEDRAQADLLVRINLGRHKRTKMSGMAGAATQKVGLDVILIDRKSGDWVWHGWATETWESELDPQTEVTKALAHMFEDFPPTK